MEALKDFFTKVRNPFGHGPSLHPCRASLIIRPAGYRKLHDLDQKSYSQDVTG